jgi:HD-GYP domain-containing protein (c-di-GMP phosphodiesterase class II)
MSSGPSVSDQEQLALTLRGQSARMSTRERIVVSLVGIAFVAAAAGLWLVDPPHRVDIGALVWTLIVTVLANRVRFETPFGHAVATQVAFVPLVLVAPPALVPIAACLTLVLAALPDVLSGRLHPVRLFYVFRNCWYAMGPAWVFALSGGPGGAGPAILVAALLAQFLVDFVSSSLIVFAIRGTAVRDQGSETWIYFVDAALSCVGYVVGLQTIRTPWAVLAVVPLLGVLAVFARERAGRLESLLALGETYRGTALLLGDVVAADDTYTGMHSKGVVVLALAVAEALGLSPERRRNLEFAAMLHDVGKITIPKAIIHKPGKLNADEWRIVQTHSEQGQHLLARVGGFMTEVGTIVRSHHERWDGGGYPDGLRAEATPLEARIITCCDSWSAMRTDRPYRRAMSHQAAIEEFVRNIGTQFDPRVAQALLSVVHAGDEPDAAAAVAAGLDSLLRA